MACVLIVRCFPDEAAMYQDYLGRVARDSMRVSEPSDAFEAAVSATPDVIVTDLISEAGWDGTALIEQLRHDHRTQHVGLVVVTGRATLSEHDRALRAGCDIFLPKPCAPDTLLSEIRRAAALSEYRKSDDAELSADPIAGRSTWTP